MLTRHYAGCLNANFYSSFLSHFHSISTKAFWRAFVNAPTLQWRTQNLSNDT